MCVHESPYGFMCTVCVQEPMEAGRGRLLGPEPALSGAVSAEPSLQPSSALIPSCVEAVPGRVLVVSPLSASEKCAVLFCFVFMHLDPPPHHVVPPYNKYHSIK